MKTYEMSKEEQHEFAMNRSIERGKYTHLIDEIDKQYRTYKPIETKEEWKERHRGIFVKFPKEQIKKGALRRVFESFLKNERINYFMAHDFTVEDIVRIGIDKFVVANGWTQPRDASSWRGNVVRIGVCPHCKDQFVTKIYEANHGLCRNCVPEFSSKAIQGFLTKEAQSEDYQDSHASLAVNFYLLFDHDEAFRNLFLKDRESAAEYEAEVEKYEEKLRMESEPGDEKKDDNIIDISEDGEVIE